MRSHTRGSDGGIVDKGHGIWLWSSAEDDGAPGDDTVNVVVLVGDTGEPRSAVFHCGGWSRSLGAMHGPRLLAVFGFCKVALDIAEHVEVACRRAEKSEIGKNDFSQATDFSEFFLFFFKVDIVRLVISE